VVKNDGVNPKVFEKALKNLKKDVGPQVVGWSNKIRNGKVRVYVSEHPTAAGVVNVLNVAGKSYEVEYYRVGTIKIL